MKDELQIIEGQFFSVKVKTTSIDEKGRDKVERVTLLIRAGNVVEAELITREYIDIKRLEDPEIEAITKSTYKSILP